MFIAERVCDNTPLCLVASVGFHPRSGTSLCNTVNLNFGLTSIYDQDWIRERSKETAG